MSTALLRRLAPLSLFVVPFLVPVLVSTSNAATINKAHHRHHKATHAASSPAKATAQAKAATSSSLIPAAARNVAFGTSLGGNSSQTVKLFPNARIGRVFENAPEAALPSLPSTYQIWLSFNVNPGTVASGAYNAQFGALLQAWNKSGRTVYWDWQHEADNPADHLNPTQIRAGWAQLLSVEKKYPSPKVKSMSIYEGYLLSPNQPHGNPANWYVNADVLGFDCYIPDNVVRAMAYAKSKGKPWAIPEFGNHGGDASDLAYIQSTIASWASYPPIGAAWYNNTAGANFSQPLAQIPHTLAYLKLLAAG
jgi:hypothetical protein